MSDRNRIQPKAICENCSFFANYRGYITIVYANFLNSIPLNDSLIYDDVFSLKDESEMGHIRLSREADLIVIAPASADIIGKMANGLADDLASTILLATDKNVLVAPAMNIKMFSNNAVQRNVKTLQQDGIIFVGPEEGELACGETGIGRMSEPDTILKAIKEHFNNA